MKLRGIFVITLAAVFLISAFVFAQNPSSAADENHSAQSAPTNPAHEKAQGDENAEFKHSWSVEKLAKLTHLSADHAYWLAVVLNFVVVVSLIPWILKLIVGTNLRTAFGNRTASIHKSIEEARRASEDANRRLADIESRLSRMDDEISAMRATSEKEGATEETRIKAAAEEDARRIVESAEQEIAAATKAARRELTVHAADLAVSLAMKQINVDKPTDQALLRRFAQQLSSDGSSGKKA